MNEEIKKIEYNYSQISEEAILLEKSIQFGLHTALEKRNQKESIVTPSLDEIQKWIEACQNQILDDVMMNIVNLNEELLDFWKRIFVLQHQGM